MNKFKILSLFIAGLLLFSSCTDEKSKGKTETSVSTTQSERKESSVSDRTSEGKGAKESKLSTKTSSQTSEETKQSTTESVSATTEDSADSTELVEQLPVYTAPEETAPVVVPEETSPVIQPTDPPVEEPTTTGRYIVSEEFRDGCGVAPNMVKYTWSDGVVEIVEVP